MSQVDTEKIGSVEKAEARGCGCGGHGQKDKKGMPLRPSTTVVQPTVGGASETSECGAPAQEHAHQHEHGSGCCGGRKAHE